MARAQKKKTPEATDFEKSALVVETPPAPDVEFVMDGTRHTEISQMANPDYSTEIIGDVKAIFDPGKLESLRKEDEDKFLEESENQVKELWARMQALTVHTALFNVSILIAIGTILNQAEDHFKKKSKYMKWVRGHFGHKHIRYFQQAKQLAKMGETARKYASLGKNCLLEWNRVAEEGKSCEDLLRKHSFEDTTEDLDGKLFKLHIDAITTFRRFELEEVRDVEFEDAKDIASFLHQALPVRKVREVKEWLDAQEDRKRALSDIILNRLFDPYDKAANKPLSSRKYSLDKVLSNIKAFEEDVEKEDWATSHKDKLDKGLLIDAYNVLKQIADKLQVELPTGETLTEKGDTQ